MTCRIATLVGMLCALVLACSLSTASAAGPDAAATPPRDELAQREAVASGIYLALARRDFRELEALAARYRDPSERTSSGLWKLTIFYGTVLDGLESLAECAASSAPVDELLTAWEVAIAQSPTLPLVRARYRLCAAQDALAAADGSPPAWATFANVTIAIRLDLERHRDLAATDPYWFEARIALAEADGARDKDLEPLLADLGAHRPAFYQAWFKAMDVLLRRDRASADASIAALATRAAHASRADEGDGLYARMWWYAFQVHYGDEGFADAPVDWPRMLRGMDDVLARYPDPWNLNNFARIACARGDAQKTAALIRRIGDRPVPQAWGSPQVFAACRNGEIAPGRVAAAR